MKWYRIGNNVRVTWTLFDDVDGVKTPADFSGKSLLLFLVAPSVEIPIKDYVINENVISFTFPGKRQRITGAYSAKLCEIGQNEDLITIDTQDVFGLKPHSWLVGGQDEEDVDTYSVNIYSTITAGEGKSAYEIAVLHGFEGTEEEWLESLKANVDKESITEALGGTPILNTDFLIIDCGSSTKNI